MNLLLFGAPGTGKGTQSAFLTSHYKLCHISTGDLFRKALNEKTSLGLKAESYMCQGKLVPDSIVISLIKEVLVNPRKNIKKTDQNTEKNICFETKFFRGFILDGFPRTLAQAESLDSLLRGLKLNLDKVLLLNVPESILIERITGRRVAKKSGRVYHIKFSPPKKDAVCDTTGEPLIHRKDDKEEVIKARLKTYHKQTFPLIEYYRKKNILCELDGCGSPKEVFLRIQKKLPKQ